MTDTTTPEYRLQQFEAGFLMPILLDFELFPSLRTDDFFWNSDWRADRSGQDSPRGAPAIHGRVAGEAVHWMRLGQRLGMFPDLSEVNDGRLPSFVRLADEFADLAWEEQVPSGGRAIEDHWDFNAALGAAIEDSNPDRLEFVRVTTLASAVDRQSRIDELYSAATLIEQAGEAALPDSLVNRISWALAGQGAAVDGWDSPANWRSSRVPPTDDMSAVLRAAVAVAESALAARLGRNLPREFVIDLMYGESLDGAREPSWDTFLPKESQSTFDSTQSAPGQLRVEADDADEGSLNETEAPQGRALGALASREIEAEEKEYRTMGDSSD